MKNTKRRDLMVQSKKRVKKETYPRLRGSWFYSFIPFKIATGGITPLIPTLALEVNATPLDLSYLSGTGSLSSMIGGLLWGALSDRFKRRKVFLILGLIGASLFILALGLSSSIKELIVVNALYTFFLAATIPLPAALIAREFRKSEIGKATGRFNEIGGWAWVAGLILGLLLLTLTPLKFIPIILGLIGAISVVSAMKRIREVPVYINGRPQLSLFMFSPRRISIPRIEDEVIKALSASTLIMWIGSMLILTQYPMVVREKGFDGEVLYGLSIASSTISALTYKKVGELFKGITTYLLGLEVRIVGMLLLLISTMLSGYSFIALAILGYLTLGYSWSMISVSSSAIITERAPEKKKGAVMGSYNFISSTGAIVGSFTSGYIVNSFSATTDFVLGLTLTGLSMVPIMMGRGQPLNFGLWLSKRGKGLGL
ncbi:MFS transporter [Pyrococcus furiosus DSM 3638]|uniref:Major facilitator superfamily (MFS) profile domain-containing protein n=4 Tax=Thermococcaceae TaxID=2259 RepID=Q8U177_PYRFU|nr:hypothetical protein PF1350 [Pyrococcus furiosus DSM 3638]AFN04130.1 hypothetical protein PFC_05965 [Pyrococcus furiosus COM1]QEK78985.1 MFS transporter [Pyrococcus furiosus DSM 3638]